MFNVENNSDRLKVKWYGGNFDSSNTFHIFFKYIYIYKSININKYQ